MSVITLVCKLCRWPRSFAGYVHGHTLVCKLNQWPQPSANYVRCHTRLKAISMATRSSANYVRGHSCLQTMSMATHLSASASVNASASANALCPWPRTSVLLALSRFKLELVLLCHCFICKISLEGSYCRSIEETRRRRRRDHLVTIEEIILSLS